MDLLKTPAFAAHVESLLKEHHTPGVSIAIVHDDAFSSAAFGKSVISSDAGSEERDCTPDTLFDIASCSKSLTAAAVALLVEDDVNFPNVKWDSKMSDLLPEDFVLEKEEYTRDVTIEDILSHRSGLPSHDSAYMGTKAKRPDTAKSITRKLRHLPLAKPIRSSHMYCNLMFTVATHLIETLTNKTFSEFLQERIFAPLNLTSTFLQPSSVPPADRDSRLACGYSYRESTSTYHAIPVFDTPEDQGAGSIITSVNDYIVYVHALMTHAPPFTQAIQKALVTPRFALPEYNDDRERLQSSTLIGLGWEIFYYRGHRVVQHDGSISGLTSTHFFLPARNFAAVILCNGDAGYPAVAALVRELIDQTLGVEPSQRLDWPEIFTRGRGGWFASRESAEDVRRRVRGEAESEDADGEQKEEEKAPSSIDTAGAKDMAELTLADQPEKERGSEEKYIPPPFPTPSLPLDRFTGEYHHAGYDSFVVGVRASPEGGEALFIDAADRCMGFGIALEFVCRAEAGGDASSSSSSSSSSEVKFLAYLTDVDECETEILEAVFVVDGDDRTDAGGKIGKARRLGINLDEDIEGLIWFERV